MPHLGAAAKQLYVFSRTPSSVDTRDNRPTDVEWFKSLKPGWQALRQENFSLLTLGGVAEEDLVGDKVGKIRCGRGYIIDRFALSRQWTSTLQFILSLKKKYAGKGMKNADLLQIADFQKVRYVFCRLDDL